MANVTESATYDAGVYQLEVTNPVTGGATGVANYQAKNLANRTAYLKSHVDTLETSKNASGGYPGLTLFALNLKNVAGTFVSLMTNTATAVRTWAMPDKSGTIAMTSDITGTNSGTNTGDQTNVSGTAGNITGICAVANGGTGSAVGGLVSLISTSTTAVVGKTYVLAASLTLTLPTSPAAGSMVSFSNRSGTTTAVIARNGQNIMGLAQNLTIDSLNAGGTLVFADATRGWVLI